MSYHGSIIHRRYTTDSLAAKWVSFIIVSVILAAVNFAWAGGGPNVSGAKLYIQQNNLERALKSLHKEIDQINENNEDAWYLLGYVYARQKKYDKMVEAFDKAVALKPEFKEKGIKIGKDSGTQFHSKFGVDLILKIVWGNVFNGGVKRFNDAVNATDDSTRNASFDAAIGSFKTAAMIAPDSTLAYRNWAAALLNAGRGAESIEPLQLALKADPDNPEVKTMLAQVYIGEDDTEAALPLLEDLWKQGTRTVEVADHLSRIYVQQEMVEKAKEIYKIAIDANPDNFFFRYNYGTILLEADEYDEAIAQLEKAFEIDPESPDINYNLGAAYLNRGISKREALPEDSEDKAYLEDFKAAFPYLEKSIKMNPDDVRTWFTLGRIAGQLNKVALAGYAFSKGEPTRSALDEKVVVGMQSETLKAILGEPDHIQPLESEQFAGIEEWVYSERSGGTGKIKIVEPLNVYVDGGKVDALMVVK